jgi:periplasmic protein TonB
MATRAFLLCGDEKGVYAVTQILDELEVSFEHSSEPAFCLKRLAAQKFDLLIVDCDNAQNATQVFNSARASNLNKNSIAIAIVEGKAGVPNAFRLGASLVLTKPVALEQVRNTLRTGIGMARKDAAEGKAPVSTFVPATSSPASASAPALTPASPTPAATPRATTPVLTPVPARTVPATAPAGAIPPAVAPDAAAKISVSAPPAPSKPEPVVPRSVPVPTAPLQESKPATPAAADVKPTAAPVAQTMVKAAAAAAGPAPAKNFDSIFTASPVGGEVSIKESSPKSTKGEERKLEVASPLQEKEKEKQADAKAEAGTEDSDGNGDLGVPSFGGMGTLLHGEEEESGEKGGKRALIAALVLVLLGAAGYGAWATQPEFRNFATWEFQNVSAKVAALRGQAPANTPAHPAAPAPVASAPAIAPNPPAADPNASAASANAAPAEAPAPSTVSPAATAPQPADPVPADNSQKAPAVQPAKQDISTNHAGSNPALVAASASIPPAPSAKSTGSDLLEVPEDFADDQVVRRVHPSYPKQARARKLHGTVVLEAVVNKQGKVDSLQLVSGDPLLAQAAADAVKQWRYKPYLHNGEYAEFQTRVTVEFKQP